MSPIPALQTSSAPWTIWVNPICRQPRGIAPAGMNISRPGSDRVEVADIFRKYIGQYRARFKMPLAHLKVAGAIMSCRTAYLGGHVQQCDQCGMELIAYNSCRNRHCPKCQCMNKERWLKARTAELLPTRYFHVIFTLPHVLNPVVLTNKAKMLSILFKSVSRTLLEFGRNNLEGQLGIIAVLHTWDQRLRDHFHLHCLVPAGALDFDKKQWRHCRKDFLFPVKALSPVFREKYLDDLRTAFKKKKLIFPGKTARLGTLRGFKAWIDKCYTNQWVVNIRKPIDKPEYVLDYLGRYTHRVAISNNRIKAVEKNRVRFTYKNRNTGEIKIEDIEAVAFIRRFLLHVLPKGFMRIRHYGFLANRSKKINVPICRKLLGLSADLPELVKESVEQVMMRLTGEDIMLCPCCKQGRLMTVATIPMGTDIRALKVLQPP